MTNLYWILDIRDVENTQTGVVVGLVHQVALNVQVMIRRLSFQQKLFDQLRIVQVLNIPDERTCFGDVSADLVQLIVHVEELVIIR